MCKFQKMIQNRKKCFFILVPLASGLWPLAWPRRDARSVNNLGILLAKTSILKFPNGAVSIGVGRNKASSLERGLTHTPKKSLDVPKYFEHPK